MAGEDIFIVPNPADREKLLHALPRIKFPWELLRPGLAAQGKQGFTIEFADLSAFTQSTTDEAGHEHHDAPQTFVSAEGHGDGHIMFGNRVPGLPEESAAAAWGLFWFDGRIQVERTLMNQQDNIDFVISAEIAHAVDVFYGNAMGFRPVITQLLSPTPPGTQPWFGGTYWDQPGESFMAGFGLAYTDFVTEDTRFRYRFAKDDGPAIRAALNAPRTDEVAPPPPPPPPPATTFSVSVEPQDATVGKPSSGFEVKVLGGDGKLAMVNGTVTLALKGSVVYQAPAPVSLRNGWAAIPGMMFSREHPASEDFHYEATFNGQTVRTRGFVVDNGSTPPPPPPPPPPAEKYIVAVKNEFSSQNTGRSIVYYNDGTQKEVSF